MPIPGGKKEDRVAYIWNPLKWLPDSLDLIADLGSKAEIMPLASWNGHDL